MRKMQNQNDQAVGGPDNPDRAAASEEGSDAGGIERAQQIASFIDEIEETGQFGFLNTEHSYTEVCKNCGRTRGNHCAEHCYSRDCREYEVVEKDQEFEEDPEATAIYRFLFTIYWHNPERINNFKACCGDDLQME
jgi:hypothetical protein